MLFNLFENQKVISFISDKSGGNMDFRFDSAAQVKKNRQNLLNFLGNSLTQFYEMGQIHGSQVMILEKRIKERVLPKTDGLITRLKNVLLMVKIADCFPLLFFDPISETIAVNHVGWRGAMEKIFLKTLLLMSKKFQISIEKLEVVIGPGARKCCFKHQHLIQEKLPEWKLFITEENKNKALDIPGFIKSELVACGVKAKNIKDLGLCTICQDQFFSHFRSLRKKEPEGRLAAIIGLKE